MRESWQGYRILIQKRFWKVVVEVFHQSSFRNGHIWIKSKEKYVINIENVGPYSFKMVLGWCILGIMKSSQVKKKLIWNMTALMGSWSKWSWKTSFWKEKLHCRNFYQADAKENVWAWLYRSRIRKEVIDRCKENIIWR